MGTPQPASAVLGHQGMMLPELIGMLRLNSLMFKSLVIFWWKVLSLRGEVVAVVLRRAVMPGGDVVWVMDWSLKVVLKAGVASCQMPLAH